MLNKLQIYTAIVFSMVFSVLRTLYFYGSGGGALTFLDPYRGATDTELPVVGNKDKVIIRDIIAYGDTPTHGEFVNLKLGSDGDYHDIQIFARGDGDNITAGMGANFSIDLGDWELSEGVAISGTALATGQTAGMIEYEDGEPEIPIPSGRTVFMTSIASGDLATSLATTNIAQPNATKALNINSEYYLKAVTTMPEDKMVQAFILKTADGMVAAAPPKGRHVYSSCPAKFPGKQALSVLGQVQAGAKASAIWEMVEVPLPGKEGNSQNTRVNPNLSVGGSLLRAGRNVVSRAGSFLGF